MAKIFISHSSRDNTAARHMFEWVRAQGFEEVFLDIDKHGGIPPGAKWEQELYTNLERAQAVILVLTENWMASKWCFAEFAQARALGKAIFPVIETPQGDTFVGEDLQTINLLENRAEGLERLGRRLTDLSIQSSEGFTLPAGAHPFPGLAAFGEDQAAVYFGRDDAVARLIERLRKQRTLGDARLTVILGASGSGKSSLLRAGLLPRLKRDREHWVVAPPLRPETRPFERLVDLLLALPGEATTEQRAAWEKGLESDAPGESLARIARLVLRDAGRPDARLLVAVDQAEELFTLASAEQAQRFFALLSAMLEDPDLPFAAVFTLRSGNLDDLQRAEHLTAAFEPFTLDPMPKERIPAIVRGPARIAHLAVDDALIAALLQDVEGGAWLPLVAFALREIYDRYGRDGDLTLADYHALADPAAGLNPLENAVRRAAEEALPTRGRREGADDVLREAFIPALVRVNRDGAFVRQAAPFEALPEAAQDDIRRLVEARLLVNRDGAVEVAHEALFRVWPRLAEWLEGEREFLVGLDRVRDALADWEGLARGTGDAGALLSGVLMERAQAWLTEHPGRLTEEEATYIRRSTDAAEAETRRRRRQQRTIVWGSAAAAIVFAVLGGWAIVQGNRAQEGERAALEGRQAAEDALRTATDAANNMVFELAQKFKNASVPNDVVIAILDNAIELQDNLIEKAPANAFLLGSRAASLMGVGDLYLQKGDKEGAINAYNKSYKIITGILKDNKNNIGLQKYLSANLSKIAKWYEWTGDFDNAEVFYKKVINLNRYLLSLDPENLELQQDVSMSLVNLGDLQYNLAKTDLSEQLYKEALNIMRHISDVSTGDGKIKSELAISLMRLGSLHLRIGDWNSSKKYYEESLEISRSLLLTDENNTFYLNILGDSFDGIARSCINLDNPKCSFENCSQSLHIRESVSNIDRKNIDWKKKFAISLENCAAVLWNQRSYDRAAEYYVEDLRIRKEIALNFPEDVGAQIELSFVLAHFALFLWERQWLNQYGNPLEMMKNSESILEKFIKNGDLGWKFKENIAKQLMKHGDFYITYPNNDSKLSIRLFQKSLTMLDNLLERDSRSIDWRRMEIGLLWRLADISTEVVSYQTVFDKLNRLKMDGMAGEKDVEAMESIRKKYLLK